MKKLLSVLLLIALCMSLCACGVSEEEQATLDRVQGALLNLHFSYNDVGTRYTLSFTEDNAVVKAKVGGEVFIEEYKYELGMGRDYYRERVPVIELKTKHWEDLSVRLDTEGSIMSLDTVDGKISFTRIY